MLPCGDLVRSMRLDMCVAAESATSCNRSPPDYDVRTEIHARTGSLPSFSLLARSAIHPRVSDLASASPCICSAKVASRRRQSQWVRARAYVRGRLPLFALREPSEARRGEGEWGQLLRHSVVPRSLAHSPTRSTANFSSGGD